MTVKILVEIIVPDRSSQLTGSSCSQTKRRGDRCLEIRLGIRRRGWRELEGVHQALPTELGIEICGLRGVLDIQSLLNQSSRKPHISQALVNVSLVELINILGVLEPGHSPGTSS